MRDVWMLAVAVLVTILSAFLLPWWLAAIVGGVVLLMLTESPQYPDR